MSISTKLTIGKRIGFCLGLILSFLVLTATVSTWRLQTVDIIDVIDAVPFQTNMLAPNAAVAVDAARAGEQGKGFSEMATEVRSLTQRSAAEAKEIDALIGNLVEKVEIGSRPVGHVKAHKRTSANVAATRHGPSATQGNYEYEIGRGNRSKGVLS